MSCHRHGYPWLSLATSPYRSSPLAGVQGYIPYAHIAAVCMFELVFLLLPGHMWGVHHLESSDYYLHLHCYSHNVLADICFSLFQVLYVKLRSLFKTSNWNQDIMLVDIFCLYFWQNYQINILHHHHVVPLAWISRTLSSHFSLSFIASGRFSGLHPVPSHSCCIYVRAGRPTFARPYLGVHRSTSVMSSSLLLQQCPACLVRLTCIVFVMGGRWPYNWCLVGCCRQDLFNIARNNLV